MFYSTTITSGQRLMAALKAGDSTKVMMYLSERPNITNDHFFACGYGFAKKEDGFTILEQLCMMQHRLMSNTPVPVTHTIEFLELSEDDKRLEIFQGIMAYANPQANALALTTVENKNIIVRNARAAGMSPFYFFACGIISAVTNEPQLISFAKELSTALDKGEYVTTAVTQTRLGM